MHTSLKIMQAAGVHGFQTINGFGRRPCFLKSLGEVVSHMISII
jgi:hypothetical protein